MARSSATTVEAYLEELPAERRAVISAVRELIRRRLPQGYAEAMNWGMISYEVPLERHRDTYNRQPLAYIGLAAQKSYYTLYLMAVPDGSPQKQALEESFAAAGKRLDMGRSCLRFRKLDELPLEVIGDIIAGTPPEDLIAYYEAARRR
jgi:hypothetical protein